MDMPTMGIDIDAPTMADLSEEMTIADRGQTRLSPTIALGPDSYKTPFPSPDDMTRTPDPAKPYATAGPLAIGQMFGPRYRIMKLLGIGGMGAVYQAWDHELDVVVALKVIRPESTIDAREVAAIERRFKQELLLARQVTHKNVVRIHDLGEIGGIKYITMSYIHGDDLATVLQRKGKLPVAETLKLTRQIASGLLAAHEAGVVHRDLKPANIMIEGDHAVIMDFGIARSSGGAQPQQAPPTPPGGLPSPRKKSTAQTVVGSVVGTITYMAPEQARGEAVDQRADLYALGLIISDMLLSLRRRGVDVSAMDDLQKRMTERPEPLRKFDATIPEAFDKIITRLAEPDAAARFQTTAELVAALDRLDDNGVPLPLIRRLTPRLVATAAVVVITLLAGTFYVTRQALAPPVVHDPVTVLIADFQNSTGDATFDRALELPMRRALEGAGFISAYDRTRVNGTFGVRPPEKFDETAAREIAVKQGVPVVVAGSITPQGSGYGVGIRVIQALTGNVIATSDRRASSKDDVLGAAMRLAATARTALGDESSESDQMLKMTSLSVLSLDVVRHYAAGMEAQSFNRFEEARQNFAKAVELDPKFGLGYSSLAGVSRNLGNVQDAVKYTNEALQYLDGMTERERYATRGFYYRITGDYQQCVKEYGELVTRYAADVVGRNQRALCMSMLRDLRGAVEEMRFVVNMLPNRAVFRDNLALYSNYAGDFETGRKEAETVGESDGFALIALALSQIGQNQFVPAVQTYQKLQGVSPAFASMAASGLADLAAVEGRYADAIGILNDAVAVDLAAKSGDRAANKLSAIAYIELLRGRKEAAVDAATRALASSQTIKIRFMATQALIEAGEMTRARPIVDKLVSELQAEPQAFGKILEGQILLKNGDARQAIKVLTEANALIDTWIGHFVLGRAYLEAGALIQADSEFDRCIKRRGEALSLFLDQDQTFAYFPPVYYYQGRVREQLKNAGFVESYKAYLAFRGQSKEDPLLADVRKRVGS